MQKTNHEPDWLKRQGRRSEKSLGLISGWKPRVIVSDIGMPGEHGYHLMRKIRALTHNIGAQIPAIALTGYASQVDESKVYAAGYQVHMTKPAALHELVTTIANLLGDIRDSAIQDRDLDMRLDAP